MNDTTPYTPESGPDNDEKGGESRRARSIRFSDPEWETVEKAATERGMNTAEFARHAALGVARGRYGTEQGVLPPQFVEMIERIFPQHPHPRDAEARGIESRWTRPGVGRTGQVNSLVTGIASRKLGDDELCGRRTG